MDIRAAVALVHADFLSAFDGTPAEAVEHARDTLILPDAEWCPGSFRLVDDGSEVYAAYVAVITASADSINSAIATLQQ